MAVFSLIKALVSGGLNLSNIDKAITLVDNLVKLAEATKQSEQQIFNPVQNLPQQNSSPVAGSK